jgi:ferric-dicitrate binding protein FerR (iron transport regulator)
MGKHVFFQLLDRYLGGSASPEEKGLLKEYYARLDQKSRAQLSKEEEEMLRAIMLDNIWGAIRETEPAILAKVHSFSRLRYAAALVAVILFSAGAYFVVRHRQGTGIVETPPPDIAPGGNHAILTLSNGKTIILDHAAPGEVASQGNSRVIKVDSGMIAYHQQIAAASGSVPVQYNVLTTPRGGQYQLLLPDGSKIWLNAASSIRYPTVFSGGDRTVEITGEAYFEVAENSRQPFKVSSGKVTIKVLGTHFDVNAYGDEANLKVTLLQGSVSVEAGGNSGQEAVITRGRQAKVDQAGMITVVRDADTEEAVAWKEGLFRFGGTTLQEVLRQISRWYDVKIVYKDTPAIHLGGVMSRQVRLSQVIRLFRANGVDCNIENRVLTVQR